MLSFIEQFGFYKSSIRFEIFTDNDFHSFLKIQTRTSGRQYCKYDVTTKITAEFQIITKSIQKYDLDDVEYSDGPSIEKRL